MFGTVIFAAKCMYELQSKQINVENFLNNHCQIKDFCREPVVKPNLKIQKIYLLL